MVAQFLPILALIVLSAFFSASETAFTSLSFLQIRMLETSKGRLGKQTAILAKQSDVLLTTILIGNNIVNLSASALTTSYAISIGGSTAIGIATGILTFVILLFGEIAPKQLAIAHNTTVAKIATYPIRFFIIVLYPIVFVVKHISSLFTRFFTKKQKEKLSVDSLMHVVDVAEDEGIVDEYETSLVQRVLHFSEATVKSIMTHRTDVFSIPTNLTLEEAFPPVVNSGFSRIPVYEETPENITGILLIRDMLAAVVSGRVEETVSNFMLPPIFVPETRKVDDMLFQFKKDKLQIAVVLDEYGGLSGI
ncbi:MAG: hemolysin family protein, partial [Sphaerochaetaceae bacterium]|nr:hemolysin family protein [Sphaerochaetaceae bacterium]